MSTETELQVAVKTSTKKDSKKKGRPFSCFTCDYFLIKSRSFRNLENDLPVYSMALFFLFYPQLTQGILLSETKAVMVPPPASTLARKKHGVVSEKHEKPRLLK